ncbi:MAG TPA: trypsin-like peptidase domain-containing protein [Planctomycetota bacterium]|nr:trypsin-like peptidase domain-containing protein [Planctomycetota bacterium]
MSPIVCLLLALAAAGDREVFHLGGGARIEGAVVKETGDAVFVDLGFTVLGIPLREIVSRETVKPADAPATPSGEGEIFASGSGGAEGSVRELAERLGSSVVLVSCSRKSGSGFFISGEGHVVTNAHVVEGERRISLTLFERREGADARRGEFEKKKTDKVKILAVNPYFDLALLQLEDPKSLRFSPAPLGASAGLEVGERVFAIGNPMGLERTVTEGIVSTTARASEGLAYVQTTTQINPGNSGGPLFNLRGEVVGVTNMKLLFAEGLGFAIPVDRLKEFLRQREAFAFDADNPNTGYRYLPPPPRRGPAPSSPVLLKDESR